MIRLSLVQLKGLLDSLQGDLVEVLVDSFSEWKWGLSLPLKVCVVRPHKGFEDTTHYLYLVDFIGYRMVGERLEVHLVPRYGVDGSPHYLTLDKVGGRIEIASGWEYGRTNQPLHVSRTPKPVPRGPIRYPNPNYYTDDPYVITRRLYTSFLPQVFDDATQGEPRDDYTQWVIDYLGRVEMLYLLEVPHYMGSEMIDLGRIEDCVTRVDNLHRGMLKEVKECIGRYPG